MMTPYIFIQEIVSFWGKLKLLYLFGTVFQALHKQYVTFQIYHLIYPYNEVIFKFHTISERQERMRWNEARVRSREYPAVQLPTTQFNQKFGDNSK